MKSLTSFTTLLLMLFAISLTAQQGINYKAIIKDGGGNVLASQPITVQFTILKGAGLSNVYQETHSPTTDANGIIIINIGEGTLVSGSFTTIDWGSDTHAIKTEIDTGAGLVDMGTTQFMAVPYALHAANAITKIDNLTDGKSDSDGSQNGSSLFLGVNAGLNDDSTNNRNAGIGFEVLKSNTTGSYNTATGYKALTGNGIGGYNTATGYEALTSNSIGNHNTANGASALTSNSTGNGNTANGTSALAINSTGSYNTANGISALFNNSSGNYNTANGTSALTKNTIGNYNTANGSQTLYNNTEGEFNAATGYNALYNNTVGVHNTANGSTSLNINSTGNYNTANGSLALRYNTTGSNNTANGASALINNTTGSNNTAIGYNAQVLSTTGSNQVQIGNTAVTYAGVQVAWTVPSDKRWKKNIRDLPYGLDVVMQLKPVDYVRKNNTANTRDMGFIAQDIDSLLIKVGYSDQGVLTKDEAGRLSLRYNDFIALLTKAIQEQQDIISSLQSTVGSQQSVIEKQGLKINTLTAEFEEIKSFDQRIKQLEDVLKTSEQ